MLVALLLSGVFGTHWVSESVLEHLVLKVCDLALLVPVSGAFDGRTERAIVFVTRPDRHVIEATIGDPGDTHGIFVHRIACRSCITARPSRILNSLTRIALTLIGPSSLRACGHMMTLFILETGVRFYALFTADAPSGHWVTPLMISRLLQLLTLLQVAQLVYIVV